MDLKVGEVISRQIKLWKQIDSWYLKDVFDTDAEKMLGLENYFFSMVREVVFESMVYIWSFTAVPSGAAV